MSAKTIPAGKFKTHCLALLGQVARTGQAIVVTKRGKPIARLVPLEDVARPSLKGSILREGDLIAPIDEEWELSR